MKEVALPLISDYLNYRQYLKDFYETKKKLNSAYSYRVFINKGELGSPSHLKMVIDGSRNLTINTIPKYQKAIGFKRKQDLQLFELLVHYNQSENPEEKINYFNQIMDLRKKKGLSLLEKHQFDLLSQWYYVAIYVLVDIKNFTKDPEWIVARLKNKVTVKQVEQALNTLVALKLIVPDSVKGFRQSSGALSMDDEVQHLSVYRYHHDMIELAVQSLRNDSADKREFNGVTIPIDMEKLPQLKEKIRAFRKELNEFASNMEAQEEVYQLNIQLFPITEVRS